jgi:hypothetical protein
VRALVVWPIVRSARTKLRVDRRPLVHWPATALREVLPIMLDNGRRATALNASNPGERVALALAESDTTGVLIPAFSTQVRVSREKQYPAAGSPFRRIADR